MDRIILASASPRRRHLIEQIGLLCEVMVSGVEENEDDDLPPQCRVLALAERKAEIIAKRNPGALVIGADTIVVLAGHVLEKPEDRNDAARMLKRLSGRKHSVLTGLALIGDSGRKKMLHIEETRVSFRDIEPWEIQWYLDSKEYEDKAGAYGIQGKAAVFVDHIEGCYFNVVGLPLAALFRMLKEWGLSLDTLKCPSSS